MNFKTMWIAIMTMSYWGHVIASNMQGLAQRSSSVNNVEQVAFKVSNFQTLLTKIDNQDSQIKLTTKDYQLIEFTIYRDIQTLLGSRGSLLLDVKISNRTNCYSHCIKGAVALYMDLLSSGYEGSVYEKRHAHDHCKNITESALNVLKSYDVGKPQSSTIKRD